MKWNDPSLCLSLEIYRIWVDVSQHQFAGNIWEEESIDLYFCGGHILLAWLCCREQASLMLEAVEFHRVLAQLHCEDLKTNEII